MIERVSQSDGRRVEAPRGGESEVTASDGGLAGGVHGSGGIDDAIARAEAERSHIDGKLTAYDRFEKTVRESEVDDGEAVPAAAGGGTAAVSPMAGGSGDDQCRRLRERFGATVRPYSVEDVAGTESTVGTICEELGERIALALAPNGNAWFTPQLRDGIVAAIDERRSELRATSAALDRELRSLRNAEKEIGAMVDGIDEVGSRYLHRYGFEELRERHGRLGTYRTRCDRLARERQAVLASTTGYGAAAGMDHRTLIAYLYRDRPTDHPVLTAIVRLYAGCGEGQRALRDHLSRRV